MIMGLGHRRFDAYLQELLCESQEVQINPDIAEITKALSKVQVRTRTNRLTADEALAIFRCVAQEVQSSAHAGVMNRPRRFKLGTIMNVIQVARVDDRRFAKSPNHPIAIIEEMTVSAAMQLAARQARRNTKAGGDEHAGVKRRLQIEALYRSSRPANMSELAAALKISVDELNAYGASEVTLRAILLR